MDTTRRTLNRWALAGVAIAALWAGEAAAQEAPASIAPPSGRLVVDGDLPTPLDLTLEALGALPRASETTTDQEGRKQVYEGVLLLDLMRRAGAPLGPDLRGPHLTTYLLAHARDGYQVVFSLGEIDPLLSNIRILVADTVDGRPLLDAQGPLRLIVSGDQRGARSIRMLERIEVVRVRK